MVPEKELYKYRGNNDFFFKKKKPLVVIEPTTFWLKARQT